MNGQVTLEELLRQLKRIPAKWLDDDGQKVLESITSTVERINNSTIDQNLIKDIVLEDPYALEFFDFFLICLKIYSQMR